MTAQKKALSIVLGGIILFVWNAISWMALPLHSNSMNNIPEAAISTDDLTTHLQEDGVYHYPGLPTGDASMNTKAIEEKLAKGPRITMMVYKSGPSALFDPGSFFLSFVFNIVVAVFLFIVISKLSKKSASNIFSVSVFLALLVSFTTDMPLMAWYMFPLNYTLANIFDHIIGFGLVGMLYGYYSFKE